jgi:hypothetical protein
MYADNTHMKRVHSTMHCIFYHFKVDSDDMGEYLKEVGVGWLGRTMARTIKPRLVFEETDGNWTLRTETPFKTMVIEFTLNTEFIEITGDGRELKVMYLIMVLSLLSALSLRVLCDLKMVNGFKRCVTSMAKNR